MHEENDQTRVEPLKAGADGQDLPQSGNESSPSLPRGRKAITVKRTRLSKAKQRDIAANIALGRDLARREEMAFLKETIAMGSHTFWWFVTLPLAILCALLIVVGELAEEVMYALPRR